MKPVDEARCRAVMEALLKVNLASVFLYPPRVLPNAPHLAAIVRCLDEHRYRSPREWKAAVERVFAYWLEVEGGMFCGVCIHYLMQKFQKRARFVTGDRLSDWIAKYEEMVSALNDHVRAAPRGRIGPKIRGAVGDPDAVVRPSAAALEGLARDLAQLGPADAGHAINLAAAVGAGPPGLVQEGQRVRLSLARLDPGVACELRGHVNRVLALRAVAGPVALDDSGARGG